MLRKTEGIVLKSFPYGEADLLVTFLTLHFGLVKAFAKSPRKLKSRFGSSLEPLTHSVVSFWGREDAPLPRLTQSDIIRPFQGLRESLECFTRAAGMVELVVGLMPERAADRRVFLLLRDVLGMMERDCSALNALLFRTRFLALKGYAPRLGSCAACSGEGRMFYASQGSVLCGRCAARAAPAGERPVALAPGSVRLYEALGAWELSKIPRLRASEAMVGELSAVLDLHVEHLLSRPLRVRAEAAGVSGQPQV